MTQKETLDKILTDINRYKKLADNAKKILLEVSNTKNFIANLEDEPGKNKEQNYSDKVLVETILEIFPNRKLDENFLNFNEVEKETIIEKNKISTSLNIIATNGEHYGEAIKLNNNSQILKLKKQIKAFNYEDKNSKELIQKTLTFIETKLTIIEDSILDTKTNVKIKTMKDLSDVKLTVERALEDAQMEVNNAQELLSGEQTHVSIFFRDFLANLGIGLSRLGEDISAWFNYTVPNFFGTQASKDDNTALITELTKKVDDSCFSKTYNETLKNMNQDFKDIKQKKLKI